MPMSPPSEATPLPGLSGVKANHDFASATELGMRNPHWFAAESRYCGASANTGR